MPASDQSVRYKRKRNTYFCINRGVTAFCLKERLKTWVFFEDQYFQGGVFLSAPNKGEDLFSEIYFSKVNIFP